MPQAGPPPPTAMPAGFGLQPPTGQGGQAIPPGFASAGSGAPTPPTFEPPVIPKRKGPSLLRFIPFTIGPVIGLVVIGVFLFGGSCSSVEGSFESIGEPVGTFTFTPTQCRSGQRVNVHGAILLGEGPNDGALVVANDPVKGPVVKVEVPGSCQPPKLEVCEEVTIDKSDCKVFKVNIRRTNTRVNDIRLMAGDLELDCLFKQRGTVKAKLEFDSCD